MNTLATTQSQLQHVGTIAPKSSDDELEKKKQNLEKRCEFAVEGTNGKEHYILCRKQGECGDNKGIFLPISPADRTSLYDQTYKIVLPRCKVNGVLRYTGGC